MATLIALGPFQIVIFWVFRALKIPYSLDFSSATRSQQNKGYLHVEKIGKNLKQVEQSVKKLKKKK